MFLNYGSHMQAMDGLRVQDGNTLIAEKGRCTAAASINLITQRQMLPVVALFLKVVCFLGEFSTTSISYSFLNVYLQTSVSLIVAAQLCP